VDPYPVDLTRLTGSFKNLIGDVIEFTVEDGRLHAAGEMTADFIAISPNTFRHTTDPDITLTFTVDASEATFTVPFYWFTVYRTSAQAG
jgi:hypothetical protein